MREHLRNRLGVAIQLGSLRFLETLLEDPAVAPASAVCFAADQLSITGSAELLTARNSTKFALLRALLE